MPLTEFSAAFPTLCERLCQMRRRNRIGQAYLFVGDDTTVLKKFATAFAQLCACLNPTEEGDACGTCDACRRLAEDIYPERHDVMPESKSRIITIAQIREFNREICLSAEKNYRKLGVIAEADRLNEDAQNAFLKTLEEPPSHSHLILWTVNQRSLLPTIVSRCQVVSLRTNQSRYPLAESYNLFSQLARLQPNAGSEVALSVAKQLGMVYADLHAEAETFIEENQDTRWDQLAEDDPRLRKRLEEQKKAKIEAEYLRRRSEINDAIQTWFLQESLRAANLSENLLPHPEILKAAGDSLPPPPPPEAARAASEHIEQMLRCLLANVPENLAIEACCLEITRKGR